MKITKTIITFLFISSHVFSGAFARADERQVILKPCNGSSQQRWLFVQNPQKSLDSYNIITYSNETLDVRFDLPGYPVVVTSALHRESNNQRWRTIERPDNTWYLLNYHIAFALDFYDLGNGLFQANLVEHSEDFQSQVWAIVPSPDGSPNPWYTIQSTTFSTSNMCLTY